MRQFPKVGAAVVAAFGLATFAGGAHAEGTAIDPGKVQTLVTQLDAALSSMSCTESRQQVRQDMEALQSTIAASGASPSEAEAALEVVGTSNASCAAASVAVASVDKTIELALAGAPPQAGGGPGGSAALGGPPAFVSGGGSNYTTP